jgi:ribonuclease P protein component
MFPKKNRASKKDIDEIFKDGSFFNSANLTFKYIAKNDNFEPRISFIAPKTVSKKAVIRNRLRRLGYNTLKKYKNQFPVGLIGVFIFSKNSLVFFEKLKADSVLKLENELVSILSKLNRKQER